MSNISYEIIKDENSYFFDNINNPPNHEKVVNRKNDPYLEAIAAAIYLDGGWGEIFSWFQKWLLPKLERGIK